MVEIDKKDGSGIEGIETENNETENNVGFEESSPLESYSFSGNKFNSEFAVVLTDDGNAFTFTKNGNLEKLVFSVTPDNPTSIEAGAIAIKSEDTKYTFVPNTNLPTSNVGTDAGKSVSLFTIVKPDGSISYKTDSLQTAA